MYIGPIIILCVYFYIMLHVLPPSEMHEIGPHLLSVCTAGEGCINDLGGLVVV